MVHMTKYELWTMPSKRLVGGLKNACAAYATGDGRAQKAIEVFENEILRRIAMNKVEEWEK